MRLLWRYSLWRKHEFLVSRKFDGCGRFLQRAHSSSSSSGAHCHSIDSLHRNNAASVEKHGLGQQAASYTSSVSLDLDEEARKLKAGEEDKEGRSILAAIDERYSKAEEPQEKSNFEFLSVLQDQHSDVEDDDGQNREQEQDQDGTDASDSEDAPLVEYVRKEGGGKDGPKPSRNLINWFKLRRTIVEECVEALEKRTPFTDLKIVLERWDGMVGNALVASILGKVKDSDAAFAMFKFAGQQYNFTHDAITYQALIKFLVRVAKDYRRGALIYKYVERGRVQPNEAMMELLVEAAVEVGDFKQAFEFMDITWKMLGRLTPEICRRVTAGLFKAGRIDDAMDLFGTQMDLYGCEKDVTNYNAVLAGLAKAGRIQEAVEVFETMEARNVTSYVILVEGFAEQDDLQESMKFARRMSIDGVAWTASTYAAVVGLYGKRGEVDKAVEFYEKMVEQQRITKFFRTDPRVSNNMLAVLSSSLDDPTRLQQSYNVVQRMIRNGHVPDALQFFQLVTKLWDAEQQQQVRDLFGLIQRRCKTLDTEQCFRFVATLCDGHRVSIALAFYRVLIARKTMLDGKTFGILFSELCRTGMADQAYMLFAKLDEMDAVHYDEETHRVVFVQLCQAKKASRAFKVYASMVKQSLATDETMLAELLSGLLEQGSHDKLALAVYNAMLRRGFSPRDESSRLLAEALAKSGDPDSAEKVAAESIERSFFLAAS